MNVIGTVRIYRKDFDDRIAYSTSLRNKKMDGESEYMFMTVQFPKGTDIENKSDVNITKGFLSFYTDKDGNQKPKLVIMDYELGEQGEQPEDITDVIMGDDELPF